MWLTLDDSLLGIDPSEAKTRASLEPLLTAVGKGEHVLVGRPTVSRHLLQTELSPFPRTVLRQVLDMAPDLLAGLEKTNFRVRIVADGRGPCRVAAAEWTIPLDWFRIHGVPTNSVLGENTRDAELFRVSAVHHQALNRSGLEIRLDVTSGGGADTPRVLATEIAGQRRFVLCVTDSDQSCPTAPKSRMNKECSSIVEGSNWVAIHFSLEEREMENLLPRNLVQDVITNLSPSDFDARYADLDAISRKNPASWAYLDLKDGTSLTFAFGLCGPFWEEFIDHLPCRESCKKDCLAQRRCMATSRADCRCLLAPSLGHRIVDHVRDHLSACSPHASAKRCSTSANAQGWLKVGALVEEWGAAMPKIRS